VEVEYDYFEKRNDLVELTIDIAGDLMPTILLDTPAKGLQSDVNGRGDGRGGFRQGVQPERNGQTRGARQCTARGFSTIGKTRRGRVLKSLTNSVNTTVSMNSHKRLQAVYLNTARHHTTSATRDHDQRRAEFHDRV